MTSFFIFEILCDYLQVVCRKCIDSLLLNDDSIFPSWSLEYKGPDFCWFRSKIESMIGICSWPFCVMYGFHFFSCRRRPPWSNCIQQFGVLTHSLEPDCWYSVTSNHLKEFSGFSGYSFTFPLNTAPFLGQSGGPVNEGFPEDGSARQYIPEQWPGCFIVKLPEVDVEEDILQAWRDSFLKKFRRFLMRWCICHFSENVRISCTVLGDGRQFPTSFF